VGKILALFYNCGGPILSGTAVSGLASAWTWVTGAVTLVFIAYLSWTWRRKQRPSWVKLVLMATSFGFWWYSNVTVSNLLLGTKGHINVGTKPPPVLVEIDHSPVKEHQHPNKYPDRNRLEPRVRLGGICWDRN
jgi:hypothetical protein